MSQPITWRDAARQRLRAAPFDVLVIGGGINGAGIARDAALRGLKIALVERDDFASGTSSRSSRLVHGGVRYLEHGFLHLVFESSRERRILLRIAPHLVRPLEFTWPVYRRARIPRWKLVAGLWLYDLLALFRNVARHRPLSAPGVLAAEPGLRPDGLTGGATYFDAATDDARLTVSNVVDAARAGAVVLNHAEVTALLFDGQRATGAAVRDRLNGEEFEVRAGALVNATGPWTDTVSRMEDPRSRPAVLGTKGVHVAVPADRVANRGAVTLLSPVDGRVMFVLPAGRHTIIGTTDTPTTETPDQVRAARADVQYLLKSVNAYFPAAHLVPDDVVAAWAGIRPLIASGTAGDPAGASREHEVAAGPRGVISVTGGKLTTYRAMSAEVVSVVQRRLGVRVTASPTAARELPDVTNEFACTVADVLVRRTKLAFETRDHGLSAAPGVAAELAERFGWSPAGIEGALDAYRTEVARLFTIEP
ncbi:MAG TPA: glycerol-3-phosphate dehydrogenase/oxidase [Gemmatimonadaceae bacterium]|nr:glycerol-3-phosphate dehydrogenase/oxidase [Gemmatimonadaceae bacterium]